MLPRIELDALVVYNIHQYAEKYSLNKNELEDFIHDLMVRQGNVEIETVDYGDLAKDEEGHSKEWKRGFSAGWEECRESADIDFGFNPYRNFH